MNVRSVLLERCLSSLPKWSLKSSELVKTKDHKLVVSCVFSLVHWPNFEGITTNVVLHLCPCDPWNPMNYSSNFRFKINDSSVRSLVHWPSFVGVTTTQNLRSIILDHCLSPLRKVGSWSPTCFLELMRWQHWLQSYVVIGPPQNLHLSACKCQLLAPVYKLFCLFLQLTNTGSCTTTVGLEWPLIYTLYKPLGRDADAWPVLLLSYLLRFLLGSSI